MLTISDNTATDVLIRRVGIERVRARLAGLGFTGFHLPGTIQHEFDTAARDAGFASWEAMADAVRDAPPEEGEAMWQRVLTSPGMRPQTTWPHWSARSGATRPVPSKPARTCAG
ncbi:serine hydrolase [Streptomyces lavenduligriseus]|uniref:serine hydrolase n=1 Tax=Streptomyces lavenduligriseus TaxID=67315 RepID=UPI0024B7F97D|nr:serine hydrolase [Streptomyces lavenduligriseus]